MKTGYKVALAFLIVPVIGGMLAPHPPPGAQANTQPASAPDPKPPASENRIDVAGQLQADDYDAIDYAHNAIKEKLRDPDSAIFDDAQSWMDHRVVIVHRENGEPIFVCGRVNAKNGFGGYSGDEQYVVNVKTGLAQLDATDQDVNAACG